MYFLVAACRTVPHLLTVDTKSGILYRRSIREKEDGEDGIAAGDAGHADSERAAIGTLPRPGRIAAHPSDYARGFRRAAGILVPGTASSRRKRLAGVALGRIRKQPPRQVLPAHSGRQAPAAGRGRQLGACFPDHHTRAADHLAAAGGLPWIADGAHRYGISSAGRRWKRIWRLRSMLTCS